MQPPDAWRVRMDITVWIEEGGRKNSCEMISGISYPIMQATQDEAHSFLINIPSRVFPDKDLLVKPDGVLVRSCTH